MANMAIICRNEAHARVVRRAFDDLADCIVPGQAVMGHRWDKIICLPLVYETYDERSRADAWLYQLGCRFTDPRSEIIYL